MLFYLSSRSVLNLKKNFLVFNWSKTLGYMGSFMFIHVFNKSNLFFSAKFEQKNCTAVLAEPRDQNSYNFFKPIHVLQKKVFPSDFAFSDQFWSQICNNWRPVSKTGWEIQCKNHPSFLCQEKKNYIQTFWSVTSTGEVCRLQCLHFAVV